MQTATHVSARRTGHAAPQAGGHVLHPPCRAACHARRKLHVRPLGYYYSVHYSLCRLCTNSHRSQRRGGVCSTAPAAPDTSTATASDGLVLGLGPQGSFDSCSIGAPTVRCFVGDNEERWLMFYHGRDAHGPGLRSETDCDFGVVGVATSGDGLTWTRSSQPCGDDTDAPESGIVLTRSADWWTFDTVAVGTPDVQVISNGSVDSGVGVFWMFYSGVDSAKHPPFPGGAGPDAVGRRPRIGLALSQTGRHWARIEGEHHSGAVLDVGAPGAWDAGGCVHPQVVLAGPRDLRLYYSSPDVATGVFRIGMARSADGLTWTRQGVVLAPEAESAAFDGGGVTAPSVHRTGPSSWVMFYEAHHASSRARSIGVATSSDGVRWSRPAGVQPILSSQGRPSSSWDAGGCGAPYGVQMAGTRWRLYYEGYAQGADVATGIGVALSGTEEDAFARPFKRRVAV